jgi:hypothetical protein
VVQAVVLQTFVTALKRPARVALSLAGLPDRQTSAVAVVLGGLILEAECATFVGFFRWARAVAGCLCREAHSVAFVIGGVVYIAVVATFVGFLRAARSVAWSRRGNAFVAAHVE